MRLTVLHWGAWVHGGHLRTRCWAAGRIGGARGCWAAGRVPIRFLSGAFSSFGMHAAVPTSCSTSTAAAHPYRWVGR